MGGKKIISRAFFLDIPEMDTDTDAEVLTEFTIKDSPTVP